ncbi:substrate-binding domain-containing protein [Crossiella sp. SN42]|uniref:substrate-binding domain-containing protein n=1 Tax=Crossiella sp. SN42 TaxID=2944808 RepID=UPI00207D3F7D|nr:substrate-binding domain-containing protein [Crossiella sp. SN42]MCO1574742.1 substrate-binding domain-containing protein [Crossiella sp. SN42]
MNEALLPQERHERILAEVRRRRSVRAAELAALLGVSGMTVRRDIGHLAERGLLSRVHGGAAVLAAQKAAAAEPAEVVVGMVSPSTAFYFPDMIRGAQSALAAAGGRLVLQVSRYDEQEQWRQARAMVDAGARGLLLTPAPGTVMRDWARGLGVPCVVLERQVNGLDLSEVDSVRSDHAAGAARAVAHLAGLGHRGVALLAVDTPTRPGILEGHAQAVAALGLSAAPVLAVSQDERAEAVSALIEECARTGVTAALVHSDQDAALLLQRLRSHGCVVPRDFAVVSYDDEVAALADPPLTAVAPPKAHLGRCAAELLLAHLRNPAAPVRHVRMVPRLIVRSSCGASPVSAAGAGSARVGSRRSPGSTGRTGPGG